MTISTVFKDQVVAYQAAIVTVEAGGSATVNTRSFSSDNLSELYLRERLARYRLAEQQILEGNQSYQIGDRTLTRANINWLIDQIAKLESQIAAKVRGGGVRFYQAVPK